MRRTLFATAALVLALWAPAPAGANDDDRSTDWSLALTVGAAFPARTDITASDSTTTIEATNIESDTSAAFGASLTLWPSATRTSGGTDFGLQVAAVRWTPDIPDQTLESPLGPVTFLAQDVTTTLVTASLMARWPQDVSDERPFGRWYPYLGVGAGVQKTEITLSDGETADGNAVAFQLQGGFQIFLSSHVSLQGSAEMSFAKHETDFDAFKDERRVDAVRLTGGIGFHF